MSEPISIEIIRYFKNHGGMEEVDAKIFLEVILECMAEHLIERKWVRIFKYFKLTVRKKLQDRMGEDNIIEFVMGDTYRIRAGNQMLKIILPEMEYSSIKEVKSCVPDR